MASLSSRPRPNFFMIGAPKSGTTRLHFLLGLHPEVFTSSFKEPGYFIEAEPTLAQTERYLELFREAGDAKAIGESSTAYSRAATFSGTAQRIFEFDPQAKIIYIVRHPLRLIESAYIQLRDDIRYRIPSDFCRKVRTDPAFIQTPRYWPQLSEYRRFFPDEQILLLFAEEFFADEAATLRRYFEFLGVDPDVPVDCSRKENLNEFAEKRENRPVVGLVRWLPYYRTLYARMPCKVQQLERRLLTRPVPAKPKWDEETWRWTVEQLRPDAEKFLAHAGKPLDYWRWELGPGAKTAGW